MRERGSYTIEAAIVMSAILFILFAIISAFLLLYQNVVMTYVASQAAQQGAIMWTDTSVQMDGTRSGRDEQGPYYRIFNTGSDDKEKKIKEWAEQRMSEMIPNSMVGSGAESVTVESESNLFQRFVKVTVTKEVDIPIAGVMQYFSDDLDMSVTVRAAVSEPAEYIRTLDYAYLLSQDLWSAVRSKVSAVMGLFK